MIIIKNYSLCDVKMKTDYPNESRKQDLVLGNILIKINLEQIWLGGIASPLGIVQRLKLYQTDKLYMHKPEFVM